MYKIVSMVDFDKEVRQICGVRVDAFEPEYNEAMEKVLNSHLKDGETLVQYTDRFVIFMVRTVARLSY